MKYNYNPKRPIFNLFFQCLIILSRQTIVLQQCVAYIPTSSRIIPAPKPPSSSSSSSSCYQRYFCTTTGTAKFTAANDNYRSRMTKTMTTTKGSRRIRVSLSLLSDKYLENDLVSIRPPPLQDDNDDDDDNNENSNPPILCVVRPDGGVNPLCTHEDDNENDLFIYPKLSNMPWTYETLDDGDVLSIYGEGWYGQRVVPSLGGGPGYGAEADDVWTVDEDVLEVVRGDGVDVPVLDLGIAHGEKARGGAI